MIKVGIIGSGNIGSDLLVKIIRSEHLKCELFCGRSANTQGMKFAGSQGVSTSDKGIEALIQRNDIDIIFDATSAESHKKNLIHLESTRAFIIDMTPAKTGVLCVPDINIDEAIKSRNVNMITCGGQAAVPISVAICDGLSVMPKYIETISTISSMSAGPGTRNSLDEYIQTTQSAIKHFTGVADAKALINLNPASPPINMATTVMVETSETNIKAATLRFNECILRLRRYIQGIHVKVPPIYDHRRGCVMATVGVTGLGDYLPPFAGNLDIINCAGIMVAESYAKAIGKSK